MLDAIRLLFDGSDFPARWHCGNWSGFHGWTHIIADLGIASAYFAIPMSIAYFVYTRRDVSFTNLYWLFAAFIFSCGFGHLVESVIFWHPWYRFSALVKVGTAVISWATVFAMIRVLPDALSLPGVKKLNVQLQEEIGERQRVESRLRAMAELSPVMLFTADKTGRFDYTSPQFQDFTRKGQESALGEGWLDSVLDMDRDRVREGWNVAVRDCVEFSDEFRLQGGSDGPEWFLMKARPWTEEGETRWFGTFTNIDERKQAEAERIELNQQLQEMQRLESLGVLAGGIAHDFNNLLTGIVGGASLLKEEVPDNPEVNETLDMIEASGKRAAELCKQMLAYAGRGRYRMEQLDLTSVVENARSLIESSIGRKILLELQLAHGLPSVRGDASQLQQALVNLVLNAAESLLDAGGRVTIRTDALRIPPGGKPSPGEPDLPGDHYVRLLVEDNGCGMDEETAAKIFDPFFTTKFTGRGLGLSAVQGIVRSHSGVIHFHSLPGRGTRCTVYFPVYSGETEQQKAAAPAPDSGVLVGPARILVVDDEWMVRRIAKKNLESLGYEVTLAESGAQAIELFSRKPEYWPVVMSDFTMPGMNGAQVCHALKEISPDVKVILMSGYHQQDLADVLGNEKLHAFIRKPFTVADLTQVLKPRT